MKIRDVMTPDVIVIGPDAPIHKAARLMVDHGVSALPVVDEDGAVVGIVSEADLIVRQQGRERRSWWKLFFEDAEALAREYQKKMGTRVGDVMTRDVISAPPELSIESAALMLEKHRIRRLPVVADGTLVGIVSRGDLIKALAATPRAGTRLSGTALAAELRARLACERWTSPHAIVITADGGALSLYGLVWSEAERAAIDTMARGITGCTRVDNNLVVESDVLYSYGA